METAGSGSLRRAHRRTGRPRGRPRIERTFAGLDLEQPIESSTDKAREDPYRLGSDGRKRPGPDLDRRGRPRSTWVGKLGRFVSEFTPARLAGELEVELSQAYAWARGRQPTIHSAIAIVEVARAAGHTLALEDIYTTAIARVRARAGGDYQLKLRKAIAIVEAVRSAGADLNLEDVFARDVERIRYRIRNQLPPL